MTTTRANSSRPRRYRLSTMTSWSARAFLILVTALPISHLHASTPYIVATDFSGTDIGAKINSAIASLGSNGGTVYVPPGNYSFSTSVQFSTVSVAGSSGGANISILGGGRSATVMTYTGTAAAIVCTASGVSDSPSSGGISELTLVGSSSASIGILIKSCVGTHLDHLSLQNFGTAGIELQNILVGSASLFTERTYIDDVVASGPSGSADILLNVNGGSSSFGYTTIIGSHLDGEALQVGPSASLYNSFVQFDSNSSGTKMIDVFGSVLECLFEINAENTGQVANSYSVFVETNGSFSAHGSLRGEYMGIQANGPFYLYGQGDHTDPASSTFGVYSGDSYTRPVAADDQTAPAAVLAMSGYWDYGRGNALLMTAGGYSDGRSGLRVLNGLTATSPVVASLDNSGVLKLTTSSTPSPAAAGTISFTSLTANSATAGTKGAPPASVAGFLIINIGGTNYKIPYYGN